MSERILELQSVHTFYGESHVLQGIDLGVSENAIVGILGRNGMGKTTLLHSIMGLQPARRGVINFRGRDIRSTPTQKIARLGIALVPQGHRIFPSLTVGESLKIAARPKRNGGEWSIEEMLHHFPVLADRWNVRAGLLSGGQQQMLAMSRAMVSNADLVLMDEPTEGLDPQTISRIREVIGTMRARGNAAILVEQRVDFALSCVDEALVMSRGQVVHRIDNPEELRADKRAQSVVFNLSTLPGT